MRQLLFVAVLLCSSFGQSQIFDNVGSGNSSMYNMYFKKGINFGYGYNPYLDNPETILIKNEITYLACKTITRKGKEVYSEFKRYNPQGKLISIDNKNSQIIYTYQEDTLLIKIEKTTSKNKMVIEKTYEGKKIKSVIYKSKDKDIYSENYTFNRFDKLIHSKVVHYKKNRTYEMFYTYNELNKLTLSEYKYNGKLIKSWNHQCKPEGVETQSKSEIEVNVCKFNEENIDGSYVIYTRRINEESSSLQKDYFSKDSVLLKTELFDNDTILQRRFVHNKNEEISEIYKKGELYSKHVEHSNDMGMITDRTFYRNNKEISCRKMIYNEDNTIATIEMTYKNKLKNKIVYTY